MSARPPHTRSFHDADGHLWEVIWMDPSQLQDS
jgi:predicted lactoylglutathione lyase